jgi:AIPR protein
MPVEDALARYAASLHNEVALDASVEGAEAAPSEVFTERLIETLTEAGELEEAYGCYYQARGIEVHGYGIDDGDTLNLIATLYRGTAPPTSVTRTDISTAFRRLLAFWERCRDRPIHRELEESSDSYEMALRIHESARSITRIRLFLVTDGLSVVEFMDADDLGGVEVRRSIWDLARLQRLESSGQRREPIEVNLLEHFGGPVPCLAAGVGHEDYAAFLAVVPGEVLGRIYDAYGPRLLELNVRSFLQAKGGVNRGIRDTLNQQPGRFLAYNNGISATASRVELVDLPQGGRGIARIHDLQIVNGGQTTASIHRAFRSGVPLKEVDVQAKVTVIDPGLVEEIVPLISRFANSQNKVSEADLSANDPFHVQIEELSRTVWAPITETHRRATRWFYERARGQYADALARAGSPSARNRFRDEWPTAQKFTKTDLAKFETCWDQLPHVASLGAQKNFTLFMARLGERGASTPDAGHFERLIAKAILFKTTDRIVAKKTFGGYKANIVYYTIARLSHATAQRLDLHAIWELQAVQPAVEDALGDLAEIAFHVIAELTPGGANVTEWSKREQCWRLMKEQRWTVPAAVEPLLVGRGSAGSSAAVAGSNGHMEQDHPLIAEMAAVGADGWLAISNWAKETDNLQSWQRKIAYDIGVRIKRGRDPSYKQAVQGKKIVDAARQRGFSPS